MDKKDDLFDLIKSMSKTEKRYFKLEATKHSDGKLNNYVRLFNAIEKQTSYNAELLKSQFQNEKLGKNLSAQKYHLYELILKNLNSFHSKLQISRMLQLIGYANLLFERGLYDHSDKMINKAKSMDYVSNKLLYDILLLRMEERNINVGFHTSNFGAQLDELYKIQKIKGSEYLDFIEIRHIRNTLSYYDQLGFPRNKKEERMLKKLGKHPTMKKDERLISLSNRKIIFDGKALYFQLLGDLPSSIFYSYKYLALSSIAFRNIVESREYISSCNNLLIRLNKNGQYDEAKKIIFKLKTIAKLPVVLKSQELIARLFKATYSNEFDIYTKTGDYKTGIKVLEEIEKQLEKIKRALEFRYLVDFYFSFGVIYFFGKNYRKSIFWLNKIINHPEKDIRTDVHIFANILSLMIHFELENDSNVFYFVKSLDKLEKLFKVEDLIIDTILKSQKSISKEQKINIFIRLKGNLLLLQKDKFEKQAFDYFDFISWAESKIQNRPFADIIAINNSQ